MYCVYILAETCKYGSALVSICQFQLSALSALFVDKVVAENEGERNIYAIGDY